LRLGLEFEKLTSQAIKVTKMIEQDNLTGREALEKQVVLAIKEKVYDQVMKYIAAEGYPT